jgi:hypothetical protein
MTLQGCQGFSGFPRSMTTIAGVYSGHDTSELANNADVSGKFTPTHSYGTLQNFFCNFN